MDSTGTKPGWKTTEFYFSLLTALGSIVAGLNGILPAPLAIKISAGLAAIYAVGRTILKAISDVQAAGTTPPAA